MKTYNPDAGELTGSGKAADIPTGMEHDPNADEQVIDQQAGQPYPAPIQAEPSQPTDGKLANAIAYALDGSGPGPSSPESQSDSGHKVITEGITGAGPEDEEDAAREWRSL